MTYIHPSEDDNRIDTEVNAALLSSPLIAKALKTIIDRETVQLNAQLTSLHARLDQVLAGLEDPTQRHRRR